MLNFDTEKEFLDEIRKAVVDSISIPSGKLSNTLWSVFRKNTEKAENNIDLLNTFLNKAYRMFDIKEGVFLSILDDDLNKKLNMILKNLKSVSKSTSRPTKYLCYSIQVEDHNYCGVITKKDEKIINLIMEHYENNSNISVIFYDLNSYNKELHNKVKDGREPGNIIKEYAESLINDDSVSIEGFSEFCEAILPDSRNSCSSNCWITI